MGSADWKIVNEKLAGGFTKNLKDCPRCGNEHVDLRYYPLSNPKDDWAFYATCPMTGQPIFGAAVENTKTLTPQEYMAGQEE